MKATYDEGRGLTIERVFDAPRRLVFRAWTDPDYLHWFFSPDTVPDGPATVDLRVGGAWRQQMKISADNDYVTGGIYREIVPDEKLVFFWGAVGGWPAIDPERLEDGPLVTIVLTDLGARTHMRFRVDLADQLSVEQAEWWMNCGMQDGWNMTIDRLVAAAASLTSPVR